MTEQELDEIEARAEAATPAPWEWRPTAQATSRGKLGFDYWRLGCGSIRVLMADCGFIGDAEFIAAARTDVPRLVAEVRRLREQMADVLRDLGREE